MKILWITNCLFEEYFITKGLPVTFTGGWMRSLALKLMEIDPQIEIAISSRSDNIHTLEEMKVGRFTFYVLPGSIYRSSYDASIEKYWKEVNKRFVPDVVHIHGSEYPHGLAYVNAVGSQGVIVSVQGLISRIARNYFAGIRKVDLLQKLTFYDLFIASTPMKEQKKYMCQGYLEEELLRKVGHVVGRTTWDHDHIWAINPRVNYYFCNEILRSSFYSGCKWNVHKCQRHRIFLSQASKPIKGIHKVIEALPLILRSYPDTEVYVAGNDFVNTASFHAKLRYTTYAKYVKSLICKYGIEEKIHFTGMLNADCMAEQYQLANVFICPSAIENSPNSLGEAQLIGCPVVASYVGGIPDMIDNGKTGLLYRFGETEMLAAAVCRIFDDDKLAQELSVNGIDVAQQRHDGLKNAIRMMDIYKKVTCI
jgi:glycosyltransferase involved in cell wall biosynthesis